MSLISTRDAQPLSRAETVATDKAQPETLDNVLVVNGAFGWSGLYPLSEEGSVHAGRAQRHCNMYFVRLTASEVTREKNPIVTDKTGYVLRYRGGTYQNEAQCGVCINRRCPANRNPQAEEGEWPAGLLVLPLV